MVSLSLKFQMQCFSLNLWKELCRHEALYEEKEKGRQTETQCCQRKYSFGFGNDHKGIAIIIYKDIQSTCALPAPFLNKSLNGRGDHF